MLTEEGRLLAVAASLVRERPARHAAVVDLGGVLHIDEPVLRRTLLRGIAGDAPEGGRPADGLAAFRLAGNRVVLLVDPERLPERRSAIAKVAALLAGHGRGTVRARWFDLRHEAEAFAALARRLAAEAAPPGQTAGIPDEDGFARFLGIERALHAADLSSLVRVQVVHRLDERGHLRPVYVEVTVAIAELEAMFGLHIHRSPWLYGRVTELLDARMLYHLLRDRDTHRLPLGVKLHAETVAGDAFARLVASLPARRHGQLVVELPYLECRMAGETVAKALAVLRRSDLRAAVDHVPPAALASGDLPEVDYYRVPWQADDGARADLAAMAADVGAVGAERCILARCTQPAAVEQGIAAGFRLFQGRAVTKMAAERRCLLPGSGAAPIAAEEAEEPVREEAVRPAGPGWLARMLSRRTSDAGEAA